MTLGQRIKKLRVDNTYTEQELAILLGVSRITVNNWENDKSKPSLKNRRRIANFFAISNKYLVD